MYKYNIYDSIESKDWNKNLTKNKFSNFFQTAEYLNSQTFDEMNSVKFIIVEDMKGEIRGQLGVIIARQQNAYSSKVLSHAFKIFSGLGRKGLWSSGPIIHEADTIERNKILEKILQAIQDISKKESLSIIDGYSTSFDSIGDSNFSNEFKIDNFIVENFLTFVTNLNQDLDRIWKKIHNSTRRDINRAKKNGLYVKELTKFDELNSYLEIGRIWAKTKGIELEISEKYKRLYWTNLQSGVEKVFLAYDQEELVSTHRLGCFNKIAFSHKVTNSYSKPTSLGGPLVTWHALEWAKNSGMQYYDFSGGKAPPKEKSEQVQYSRQWDDLLNYKRKWGGDEIPYYHFIKVFHPKKYKFFRALNRLDWAYREYKHKKFSRPKATK